jgi:hypothetical protein
MTDSLEKAAVHIDDDTVAFYLEVPRSHVVLQQVFFELYDGVGTVRTLDGSSEAVVCVLTTPSQLSDCIGVLRAIKEQVAWVPCATPPPDTI